MLQPACWLQSHVSIAPQHQTIAALRRLNHTACLRVVESTTTTKSMMCNEFHALKDQLYTDQRIIALLQCQYRYCGTQCRYLIPVENRSVSRFSVYRYCRPYLRGENRFCIHLHFWLDWFSNWPWLACGMARRARRCSSFMDLMMVHKLGCLVRRLFHLLW
jgi:hypothetical protein